MTIVYGCLQKLPVDLNEHVADFGVLGFSHHCGTAQCESELWDHFRNYVCSNGNEA